nr:eukaryotic translation initiation factor 3 subunit B-like [Tanacetum cinerariifolium]
QFGDLHPQQHLCCDNCGGHHETSQCQPMNQNFYNFNSSGFDQTQPPQFPVVHPPPQETSIKISHDRENVINSMQTFLRKFNRYFFFETPNVLLLAWDRVSKIKDAFENNQYKPKDIQEFFRKLLDDLQNIHEELAEFIYSPGWNRPAVYDDDDDDVDYTIAITPVLSTKEPDNSLSIGDEHLDTIPATESDEVIKSSVEDLVPIPSEFKGIPDHVDDDSLYYENIKYVEASPHDSEFISLEVAEIVILKDEEIEDDNLREKLLKVNIIIAEIEALKDNPTPSSELLTKSSSTYPKSILEETNTFHNSLPEFEKFCFDLEEINSGSTTTHSVISLPEYEAFSFYDDHIEEISSGSTTTQYDISLPEYDSFIFDLSNDQFPPTDRSDFTHEEFGDEPAHIISPPEYDCFYFGNFSDPGELISSLNSGIRENLSSTTRVNLPVEDDYSPLLAYVFTKEAGKQLEECKLMVVYITRKDQDKSDDDVKQTSDLSINPTVHTAKAARDSTVKEVTQLQQELRVVLNIFNVISGKVMRDFKGSANEFAIGESRSSPVLRWGGGIEDKYFARMGTNVISVYKTETFSLIDKKDIKVENVMDLCWSLTDPIFALYVPELNGGNQPARVCLFQIPVKEELRQNSLFSDTDCKMDWQSNEKYLAVKVDRYTKTKKSTYNGFELF